MDTAKLLLTSVPTGLWIGGEEREGSSTFDVLDPSDDQVLTSVANATPEDAIAALDAAAEAQPDWAATPPRERGEMLRAVFETITDRAEDLATLMTLEMGKVLPESMGEVKYGAEFFRWFAEEAVRIHGRYTPSPAGTGRIIVTKQPVGPCYAITPWNFPLAMGTRKIGPAVAAGCTMIVKPAQETPLTMLLLAKLMDEAGLPKGVLSVLPTKNPRRGHHRADRRRPAAQADLHRLHRRRQGAGQAVIGRAAAAVDGAGRQRARSSCSTTPTSTPPSTARCWPRCATAARPARPPTASTSRTPCARSSPRSWSSG